MHVERYLRPPSHYPGVSAMFCAHSQPINGDSKAATDCNAGTRLTASISAPTEQVKKVKAAVSASLEHGLVHGAKRATGSTSQVGAIIVARCDARGHGIVRLPESAYVLGKAVNPLPVDGWKHVSRWRAD